MKLWNPFRRETRAEADPSWAALGGGQSLALSGQHVDAKAGESLSAVFACVQALSESTATLPLHVYSRNADGTRERADDHWLASLLRTPNAIQSGLSFRESMLATTLLHGNAFAKKVTDGRGEVRELHPLHPQRVAVVKLASGNHAFDVSHEDGKQERLLAEEVFHLADRVEPGSILGRSRIAIARETLGLGLALREHGASTFRLGARPSGVVESDAKLTTEQSQQVVEGIRKHHEGSMNSGRPLILGGGFKWKSLSMNLEDSQFVATSQLNTEQICAIFRVPPTMIGDLRHGNYSNTVELSQQFIRYSLARWIALIEVELSRQILGPISRTKIYAEHSVDAMLRGTSAERAAFYASMIASGVMLPDEARRLENLPPLQS